MKRILLLALLLPVISNAQQTAIGQWRDHLSFSSVIAVDAGNDFIFGAAPQAVVQVNLKDNSLSRYSRVNGLNDFSITAIKYDQERSMLIVGYQNGNVDFIKSGTVNNMPDIKRATIVGDKTISSIFVNGKLGYLSCGFGIVVFDLDKFEIRDTYKFGPNGAAIQVNDVQTANGYIYAATNSGLYRADLSNNFLSNFENWFKEPGLPIGNGEFTEVELLNGKLITDFQSSNASVNDQIFENTGSGWQGNPAIPGTRYSSIRAAEDKVIFTGAYRIYAYNEGGQLIKSIEQPPLGTQVFLPKDGVFYKNLYWVGEQNSGLLNTSDGSTFQSATPNGPLTNNVFKLAASNNYIYIASGAVNQIFNNGYRQDGIPYFNGTTWSSPNENTDDSLKAVFDFLGVNIDPKNPEHAFIASWNAGLVELLNGKVINIFNKNNSSIQEVPAFKDNYRIATSVFDSKGNLWVGNSFAPNSLVVKTAAGQWYSYKMGADFGNSSATSISQILVTQDDTKWMIRHRNGLYAYNDNGSPQNSLDDSYRGLTNEADNGGLPSNEVYAIAEDLDGELWLGTDKGFAIIYSPGSVFGGGPINADQPIIEQDGNFEKILETEVINSIAVDGGNRKWMATQSSGVYLLSADGTKQIQHFTTENSPLLSNEVFSVAINQMSGEVFFGTSLGVQSYLSDATGPENEIDRISVYPNPVRPEYDGPIALRGMVRDTKVKVTDIAGNIVFETTSQGGQAIWNGNNFKGERSATGVYLVFCTNEDGSETSVGKILFIK